MSDARSRAHDDQAHGRFAWPPSSGAASPPTVRAREPSAGASRDWMAVFDSEAAGPRTPGKRRVWPVHLPPRVVIAVLVALVAAQTIALVLFMRQPVTVIAQPGPAAAVLPVATLAPPTSPAPLEAAPAAPTTLSVDGEEGATVFIDGQRRGVAPLKVTDLPPGRHSVRLVAGATTATQDVTVAAASATSLVFPVPRSGWIDVKVPFRVTVFEGSRQIGASSDGPISLAAGAHTLTLRNDDLGFRSEARVTVPGGGMALLRPTIPEGTLQVNALPWANVYVDGEPVGDTPIGQLRVTVGPHDVKFVHPQLGERVQHVNVPAQGPARVSVDLR